MTPGIDKLPRKTHSNTDDQIVFKQWKLGFFLFYGAIGLLMGGFWAIADRPGTSSSAAAPIHQTVASTDIIKHSQMTSIANAFYAAPRTRAFIATLKTIGMFCGVGLTVLLLLATYGLDLSAGFF